MIKGWREDPREVLEPITEDYAMELDGVIAQLPERHKKIIFMYYVGKSSVNSIARVLRTTRHIVRSEQDMALGFIRGKICTV